MDQIYSNCGGQEEPLLVRQQTSMRTLISWNVAKAIEANPKIDLKSAIKVTQERLKKDGRDENFLVAQRPEDQYLACALLAWQQLGHSEADSLHQFVESRQNASHEADKASSNEQKTLPKRFPGSFISYEESVLSKGVGSSNYDSYSLGGPVVKLPVETKIVMRLDNTPSQRQQTRRPRKDLMNKIDAACCMESACMEKLGALDKSTTQLRSRAERLARREAERVELLERAEAAWKDLELGYQRRLAMAEEKEDDMAKHIKKLIEERNGYKNACTNLAQQLRERGEVAEKERAKLTGVEKEVCDNACMRLRVSEEAARLDATLADQHCKGSQMDRDLQFKEEQIRRQLQTAESELESARCLTHEAERALHGELSALRQQVAKVSNQLLEEDGDNGKIKEELEVLRQEKQALIDDLDGCKVMCDGRIQGKMDQLKKKKEQLHELKERVIECQCKMPVDASVEAKRTPSLAALCQCSPEDKYVDKCSCTSLRSSLLSNLLADLFGGLQAELGGCGSQMPCQLLKCLEDRHNWDKSSIVKTNLRNYFSQLLIGELDIAIANSIEKYHAKWVGASCADAARMIPDGGGPEAEGWQERALERRAQKLAAKLAEELFQERAEQLTAKAREIIKNGPPPCECKPRTAAVYPVLVKQPLIGGRAPSPPAPANRNGATAPAFWRRTHQDVTQLKEQLEDLKKDSIKKEDLKVMEENIVKLVQRVTVSDDTTTDSVMDNVKRDTKSKSCRSGSTEQGFKHNTSPKLSSIKKKQADLNPKKKGSKNFMLGLPVDKPVKTLKKLGRSYAVNLCLCSSRKDSKKILKVVKQDVENLQKSETIKSLKGGSNIIAQISSGKQNKLLAGRKTPNENSISKRNKTSGHPLCRSNIMCFHKPPSNTSINKLLNTLAKWQCDLTKLDDNKCDECCNEHDVENTCPETDCKNKKTDESVHADIPSKISRTVSALPYTSNVIVANVSKSVESPIMPITTESEYMGAVNLDYVGSGNQEYTQSADCDCKQLVENNKQNTLENSEKTNNPKIMNVNDQLLKNKEKKIPSKHHKDDKCETNSISKLSNDCQYCIKFLGVTLTNADPKKNVADRNKLTKNERLKLDSKKAKRRNIIDPEVRYNNVHNVTNKKYIGSEICDCGIKLDEVKHMLDGGVLKQNNDNIIINEQKTMDAESTHLNDDVKGCVCCNDKLDESKELEVNAFHLLEEHLREKLEEFKSSNCKSSCITPQEEERLFTTILQRVKQIITNNTGGIQCKCAPESQSKGSWNRAYLLLEEYLKIKIKRVQCLCFSSQNTKETVLPNVLEQVCTLIDNDFKRLKEVCKCKSSEINKTVARQETEKPEKDITGFTYYDQEEGFDSSNDMQHTEKVNKELSNISLTNIQNTSSQISPNKDMNTKSCDAMQDENQIEQTNRIFANKCCKVTEVNYDGGMCTQSTKITKSFGEIFGPSNIYMAQCINTREERKESSTPKGTDIKKKLNTLGTEPIQETMIIANDEKVIDMEPSKVYKKDVQNNKPYIGYTVDCSCDGTLGTCTCTKSLIAKNNDNINSIWNTLTSNKLRRNNISYIMDAVANKNIKDNTIKKENEINAIAEHFKIESIKTEKIATCERKTGAQYFDEIILKISDDNLNKHFMSATTSGDDICLSPDFNTEPIEWSQCHGILKQNNRNIDIDDVNDDACGGSINYPIRNEVSRGKSAGLVKSDLNSFSSNCDCNMVPMCHVKMLVENIENKLIHSKCTCDSLCAKICPVHSKKN